MIRINDLKCKATWRAAAVMSGFLLLAAVAGFGQQQVNLTAGPAVTTLPDGNTVPMWGYSCGALVTGATATCSYLGNNYTAPSPAFTGALGGVVVVNGGSGYTSTPTVTIIPAAGNTPTTPAVVGPVTVASGHITGIALSNAGVGYTPGATVMITDSTGTGAVATTGPAWSPVLITVPYVAPSTTSTGTSLTINLTNNLQFTPQTTGATANSIPTSIVIVGQVGGGLGATPVLNGTGTPSTVASPDHSSAQGCVTWFIANTAPGVPCASTLSTLNPPIASPPTQGPRIQSMGAEVAAVAPVATPTGTALLWANLKPGTYLLESGTHPSIQVPMGLIGVLVVTAAPTGTAAGAAYPAVAATASTPAVPAVSYNAEVPLEFSEIDPVQNGAVNAAVNTAAFSETKVWDGHTGACGDPTSSVYHTCYPPAVNYTPFYFLINGVAFSKANAAASQFLAAAGTAATPTTGTILLRLVNAGSRMHVPSIVGSTTVGFDGSGASATVGGFTVIAEDGTPVPNQGAPRVQTDVFMAAGKVFDVMVNVPATTGTAPPDLAVFARDLGLSANSSVRDSGMLAYIGVSGAALPVAPGSGIFAAAAANADQYTGVVPCTTTGVACIPFVVSDPSKGVIANDVNVYGVQLYSAPTSGTVTCSALPGTTVSGICANGTFTYTPNTGSAGSDTFTYCANGASTGAAPLCALVTLSASNLTGLPTAIAQTYTSSTAGYIKISSPGLLLGNSDPSKLPLTLVTSGTNAPSVTGGTVVADPQGGFILTTTTSATSAVFNYTVQNSQGRTATGSATVNFPTPSNLTVHVLDAQAYANCNGNSACIAQLPPFPDYKWIIEEDRTFWVDPNCTTNQSATTPGCPAIVGPAGQSTVPTFGVNFHASAMPYVAQGCTGPMSCEGGQTMLDTTPGSTTLGQHIPAVCDLGNGACRPDLTGNGFTPVLPSQVHLDPSKRYYISVLPGDAANPFPSNTGAPSCPSNGAEEVAGNPNCGHTMSGASIPPACNVLGGANPCSASSSFSSTTVNVLVLPTPLPTGKLSVIVFEDDFPVNGE
ncbi:MAG: Ig-like domain-containing protein, partial [Acidobacteria bacterium Pan2503]|nr:Ig-like domain-containing protein [Candidatus Acidoferrum panamensis]